MNEWYADAPSIDDAAPRALNLTGATADTCGMSDSALLLRAARALEGEPRVMASALAAYRRTTGMSEDVLATWLGLAPGHLPHLALCSRPDPASPTFALEVADLAAYVRCAPGRLRRLLERTAADCPVL